jgi:ribosome-associated translation inhibitor RaiA
MAKDRENMGGPTQGSNDPPTADRNNEKQPSGMSARSQSSPIGDEERSNRDGDPLSDHGVSRRAGRPDEPAASPPPQPAPEESPIPVHVNTDSSVEGSESLAAGVESTIASGLARFSGRLSRVEVHLTDQNRGKGGSDDKRCMIEARLEGLDPIAVTATAGTVAQAVDRAVGKLRRSLETTLGRLDDRRPMPHVDGDAEEVPDS